MDQQAKLIEEMQEVIQQLHVQLKEQAALHQQRAAEKDARIAELEAILKSASKVGEIFFGTNVLAAQVRDQIHAALAGKGVNRG